MDALIGEGDLEKLVIQLSEGSDVATWLEVEGVNEFELLKALLRMAATALKNADPDPLVEATAHLGMGFQLGWEAHKVATRRVEQQVQAGLDELPTTEDSS